MPLPTSHSRPTSSGTLLSTLTITDARARLSNYGRRLPVAAPGERFPGVVSSTDDAYFHLEDNEGVYIATALSFLRNLELFNSVTGANYWPIPVLLRPDGQLGQLVFRSETLVEPRLILFDVQLSGSGTDGFTELGRVRAQLPHAVLVIVSSVADSCHAGNDLAQLADISIDKSIDSTEYTKLFIELLAFCPQVPLCGTCPAYDPASSPPSCCAVPEEFRTFRGKVLIEAATPCPWLRFPALSSAYGPVFASCKERGVAPPVHLHSHVVGVRECMRALVPAAIPNPQVPAAVDRTVRAGIERAFALQGTTRVGGKALRKRGTIVLSRKQSGGPPSFFPLDAEVLLADGVPPVHESLTPLPPLLAAIRQALRAKQVFDLECFMRRSDYLKGWRPKR